MIIGLIIIFGSIVMAFVIHHFLTIAPLDPPWSDERQDECVARDEKSEGAVR